MDNEEYVFPQEFSNLELKASFKERKFVNTMENVIDDRNMSMLVDGVLKIFPFLDVNAHHLFKRCFYANVPDGNVTIILLWNLASKED